MFLRQTFSSLDPTELVAEIKQRLAEELDYRQERDNQQRFVDFYRGHPFFSVPEVIHPLCTARVLTTDLAAGATWDEALAWDQDERDLIGEGLVPLRVPQPVPDAGVQRRPPSRATTCSTATGGSRSSTSASCATSATTRSPCSPDW